MSGHSKWSNNKYRKFVKDTKKEKIFNKIVRELFIASRLGGGDEASNSRLRVAICKALRNNVNRNIINRTISRGCNSNYDNESFFETVIYEGYVLGGIAVIVECLTNNRNRTVSNIRSIFVKYKGNLGISGSVSYLFQKKGIITLNYDYVSNDSFIDSIIDIGVDDIYLDNKKKYINIYVVLEKLNGLITLIKLNNKEIYSIHTSYVPFCYIEIKREFRIELSSLINELKNLDDVENVFYNCRLFID